MSIPNSASNFIMLNTSWVRNYSRYSVAGALIVKGAAVGQKSISLIDIPAGVYFITPENEQVLETIKVVKK